ncbi:MAG TPA: histidine kinase [Mycobacteriales bacterium]|nr:histidine kinase [Mycobacteriales bacterium]
MIASGIVVGVAWLAVLVGCWRGRPALAATAGVLAVGCVAAVVWTAWAPAVVAAWLVGALALPDGIPDGRSRRGVAIAAGVVGLGWTVWLLAAGDGPGRGALGSAMAVCSVVALVSIGLRCRRASVRQRRSLQWIAAAGVTVVAADVVLLALHALIGIPAHPTVWLVGVLGLLPAGVLLGHLPATVRAAERALVEAVVVAGLAFLVVAVYLMVVVGLGRAPVGRERDVLASSVVAALVVAVLAMPVRTRLTAAGQALLGRAAAPEETLATFGARMSRAVPFDELLLQLAESLHATLGPAGAEVWVGADGVLTRTVSVPDRPAERIELTEHERVVVGRTRIGADSWSAVWIPQLCADRAPDTEIRVAPAAHGGELLGLLVVRRPVDGPAFSAEDDRALVELARQVGLALHNVALDSALQASLLELRHRNAELQASRLRIVSAADASRRAIERDLHDGAQQHLVALSVKLSLARDMITDAPDDAAAVLEELRTDVQATIASLRELAHGIYPPLLRNHGLAQALPSVTRRSSLPCTVNVELTGRYPEEVEAAVYFCCLEAIQNAGKHAGAGASIEVRVEADPGFLRFSVSDDGAGFRITPESTGSGFVNMTDRLGAIGGRLWVESALGAGTTIRGEIPVAGPAVGNAADTEKSSQKSSQGARMADA